MNKISVITFIAIIIIVTPFAYSGLNIIGANQLEYKWSSSEEFSFYAMSNNGDMNFVIQCRFRQVFKNFKLEHFMMQKI